MESRSERAGTTRPKRCMSLSEVITVFQQENHSTTAASIAAAAKP